MYVILGASGNIGSKIANALLDSGQKVRVVGRDESRLRSFSERGGEAVTGMVDDAAFLTRILEDAKAVFTMIPTNVKVQNLAADQDVTGEAISSAISVAKVPHVVNLSSLGAEHESGTGPIAGLHRQEERLNKLTAARVLHLRPTYFMENFLMDIPMIKNTGMIGSAIRGDLPLPYIATRDIAQVAADALLRLDFTDKKVRMLLGPRDYTFVQATRILGEAIGKPDLPYVQFSYEDMQNGLMAAGISADVARSYVEMQKAMNDGLIADYKRDPDSTTSTTLEQFASAVFAPAYTKA